LTGLLPFSFQFFTRLADVFEEEVGGFFFVGTTFGPIQRCSALIILRIHLRSVGKQQVSNFLVSFTNRLMQRSPSKASLRIHICTSSQVLFDGFYVSSSSSLPNIHTLPTPHQHHDCDYCE